MLCEIVQRATHVAGGGAYERERDPAITEALSASLRTLQHPVQEKLRIKSCR